MTHLDIRWPKIDSRLIPHTCQISLKDAILPGTWSILAATKNYNFHKIIMINYF